jgi:dolichol-phosphate mannosyltransferase
MTYRAHRLGARIVEVPITFEERREGASKMSKAIVLEAFKVVVALRWAAARGQVPATKPGRL